MRATVSLTRLVATWHAPTSRLPVELHLTPCIVTNPPGVGAWCDALVNPANERLAGTRFTPGECAQFLAPGNILYPPQVIDGLVHGARGDSSGGDARGGAALVQAIAALPVLEGTDVRCPTGSAVSTAAFGELRECFAHVIHTCAPFYGNAAWHALLHSSYESALTAAEDVGATSCALPLLGAGAVRTRLPADGTPRRRQRPSLRGNVCAAIPPRRRLCWLDSRHRQRGAPVGEASDVAAAALAHWRGRGMLRSVRFAVQEESVAQVLATALDVALEPQASDSST